MQNWSCYIDEWEKHDLSNNEVKHNPGLGKNITMPTHKYMD